MRIANSQKQVAMSYSTKKVIFQTLIQNQRLQGHFPFWQGNKKTKSFLHTIWMLHILIPLILVIIASTYVNATVISAGWSFGVRWCFSLKEMDSMKMDYSPVLHNIQVYFLKHVKVPIVNLLNKLITSPSPIITLITLIVDHLWNWTI